MFFFQENRTRGLPLRIDSALVSRQGFSYNRTFICLQLQPDGHFSCYAGEKAYIHAKINMHLASSVICTIMAQMYFPDVQDLTEKQENTKFDRICDRKLETRTDVRPHRSSESTCHLDKRRESFDARC